MNKIKIGLLAEAFLALSLAIFLHSIVKIENSMYLLTLPIDLLGKGLGWLSLESFFGNLLAIVLYTILSILPMIYLFLRKRKNKLNKTDYLLPVISFYCFYMLYHFINPGLLLQRIPEALADPSMLPLIKLSYAIIFYTFLISYLLLRMLDHLRTDNTEDKRNFLCRKLQIILVFIMILYTFVVCYFYTFEMFTDFMKYYSPNKAILPCTFVIISYLLDALPILFTVFILYDAIQLLSAIKDAHFQEGESLAANQLGFISKRTVIITIFCDITRNLLPFLLSKQLSDTNYTLRISLIPLVIAFVTMILSGYFKESKELYDDNEMII